MSAYLEFCVLDLKLRQHLDGQLDPSVADEPRVGFGGRGGHGEGVEAGGRLEGHQVQLVSGPGLHQLDLGGQHSILPGHIGGNHQSTRAVALK